MGTANAGQRIGTAVVREYPGWVGIHTRDSAPGCYANATRVRKVRTEVGDIHPLGALATVLGSLAHPEVGVGYFVEWDGLPRHAVFVVAGKIQPVDPA